MELNLKDIGKRIRIIRAGLDMNQADLAKILCVSAQAVSKYETGKADPGSLSLAKIAELGKTSTDWIISGKEPPGNVEPVSDTEALKAVLLRPDLIKEIRRDIVSESTGDYGQEELNKLVIKYRRADEGTKHAIRKLLDIEEPKLSGGTNQGGDLRSAKYYGRRSENGVG